MDEEELDEDEVKIEEEEMKDESKRKVVRDLDRLGREVELILELELELELSERKGVLVLAARDGATRHTGRRVV